MAYLGKTLRWRHHDEPRLPQNVVGVVVQEIIETSPFWVEAQFDTPRGKILCAMRGSEGHEEAGRDRNRPEE